MKKNNKASEITINLDDLINPNYKECVYHINNSSESSNCILGNCNNYHRSESLTCCIGITCGYFLIKKI